MLWNKSVLKRDPFVGISELRSVFEKYSPDRGPLGGRTRSIFNYVQAPAFTNEDFEIWV